MTVQALSSSLNLRGNLAGPLNRFSNGRFQFAKAINLGMKLAALRPALNPATVSSIAFELAQQILQRLQAYPSLLCRRLVSDRQGRFTVTCAPAYMH